MELDFSILSTTVKEYGSIAVHCCEKSHAECLLQAAKEDGYSWGGGEDLSTVSYWDNYEERTCYYLYYDSMKVYYGDAQDNTGETFFEFEELLQQPADEAVVCSVEELNNFLLG